VAKAARELQGSSTCSVKSAEWSLSDGLLYFRGKIYVPDTSDLCRRIIALSHDSRLAGHSGRWKMLELVSQNYWWPQMSRYVGRYVSTCDMCLRTKSFQHPPIGELHLLPIPSAPWDTISVDFIVELPQSAGHDSIMVIVDSVTKHAHFVSTVTTISAAGATHLFLNHVWKHHGLPQRVVSDRGPQFVAELLLGDTIKVALGCKQRPSEMTLHKTSTILTIIQQCLGGSRGWKRLYVSGDSGQQGGLTHSARASNVKLLQHSFYFYFYFEHLNFT